MPSKPKRILLMISLLLLGLILFGVLLPFGAFRSAEEMPGIGYILGGVPGPEDLTIDQERAWIYVSSDDRRSRLQGQATQGAIFWGDLNEDSLVLNKISPALPFEFNPHGISLFKSPAGVERLFVINHRSSGHFIEIFDIKGTRLTHLESISASGIYSPNDLVAVGIRSFYVTNDHGPEQGLQRFLSDLFRKPTASVGYYDGKSFRIVVKELRYANGIQQSKDGRFIIVAETTGKKLTAYQREFVSGRLQEVHSLDLQTGFDNLEWASENELLVAAHPNMLAFMRHAQSASNNSPSQVLSVRFDPENGFSAPTERFMVSGKTFSGSSTAAAFGNRLFIGNVFEPQIWVLHSSEIKASK
jgi:arylesterase/paraoxonase